MPAGWTLEPAVGFGVGQGDNDETGLRVVSRLERKFRLSMSNALHIKRTIDNELDSASARSSENQKHHTSMAVDF